MRTGMPVHDQPGHGDAAHAYATVDSDDDVAAEYLRLRPGHCPVHALIHACGIQWHAGEGAIARIRGLVYADGTGQGSALRKVIRLGLRGAQGPCGIEDDQD